MSKRDERFRISRIIGREVLDSRGNPTVEVEVHTHGREWGWARVPSGASTGVHEALELRDGDEGRYHGRGVLRAVRNVNEVIAPHLMGEDVRRQEEIDEAMVALDGTEDKSRLGANAILGVSLAVARAAARTLGVPLYRLLGGEKARVLPVPLMNLINGGKHAGNELAIQEFMILPVAMPSFREALRAGVEVYHELGLVLREGYGRSATNVGDEGGYAPPMRTTTEALGALVTAIEAAGYVAGVEVVLGMDSAATSFHRTDTGDYLIDGQRLDRGGLIEFYKGLVEGFPIRLLEDPLREEDFEGFAAITKELGGRVRIVGDDLFTTNVERLRRGIDLGAANTLLLKVNQVGTLSEAMDAADLALKSGYGVVVSHRSGETADTFIADLAVGLSVGMIKTGAPARGERTEKYNRLLRIEEELGGGGLYAGKGVLRDF